MGKAGALRAAGGCLGHIVGRLKTRISAPLRIGEGAHVTLEVVVGACPMRSLRHRMERRQRSSPDQLSFRQGGGDATMSASYTLADGAMSHSRSDSDFWMYETNGVLRPAVRAYLKGKAMTAKDIAAIRTYLRVWVFSPEFDGDGVEALRQTVDGLASREAIERWLATARKEWVTHCDKCRHEGESLWRRSLRLPLARQPLRLGDLSGGHFGGHFIACFGCRLAQFSKPRARRTVTSGATPEKPSASRSQFVNEDIDDADRIVFRHIVFQAVRQQRRLPPIPALRILTQPTFSHSLDPLLPFEIGL